MSQQLWSLCPCCGPRRRRNGAQDEESSRDNQTSESSPLLGNRSGRSSPSVRRGETSSNNQTSKSYGSSSGPIGKIESSAATTPAGTFQGSAAGSDPFAKPTPYYTASDLAAITGWAKDNFVSLGRHSGADRSSPRSPRRPDPSIQSLLDKLALGIASEDWAPSTSASTQEAVTIQSEDAAASSPSDSAVAETPSPGGNDP